MCLQRKNVPGNLVPGSRIFCTYGHQFEVAGLPIDNLCQQPSEVVGVVHSFEEDQALSSKSGAHIASDLVGYPGKGGTDTCIVSQQDNVSTSCVHLIRQITKA